MCLRYHLQQKKTLRNNHFILCSCSDGNLILSNTPNSLTFNSQRLKSELQNIESDSHYLMSTFILFYLVIKGGMQNIITYSINLRCFILQTYQINKVGLKGLFTNFECINFFCVSTKETFVMKGPS